ncbi:retrotransposon protein, putative, ty3-gypsy subclass [Tanacetum coccineum]
MHEFSRFFGDSRIVGKILEDCRVLGSIGVRSRGSDFDIPVVFSLIIALLRNKNGAGASGSGGDMLEPQGIHVWIERFTKLKPLAFRSAATPAEAEDWITHMEKLFQVLGCPDNFKTRLAAFKLEGDALSWWKAHLRTQVGGDAFADTCTWVAFREIFYNRYFPASEQQRYEREYGSICQLDRENSGEYMERFTRLASFVGATAGDAQRQARHFKWGLKKWVLDRIVNTDYTNVAQVAAAARNIELLHESGNSNKRDRDGNRIQNRGQGQQENKGRYDQGQHEYRGRQDQSVEHRGRQDRGYDSKRQDFRGQDQRFAGRNGNDYNQRQLHLFVLHVESLIRVFVIRLLGDDFARLPPTTGRVYATTRDQAAKTSGTITGILYIDDRTVFVLFDTGATHSIISTTFAKKLNMTPTPLIERIIISTPMKNHMLIDHEYVNCPLRFDDRIRPANLLPIHMFDFDVILGMDWLGLLHRTTSMTALSRIVKEAVTRDVGEWFSRPSVSPWGARSDFKSVSLVILYLQTLHYGSIKVKLSPNGRDLFGDGREKFSWGLCYYRRLLRVSPRLALRLTQLLRKGYTVMHRERFELCFDAMGKVMPTLQAAEAFMKQRRWLELLKDYDTNIQYHPGKANVVADALSRKSGMIACFDSIILRDLERLDVELCVRGSGGYWASMRIESNLMLQIKEAQRDDGELWAIVQNVEDGKHTEFSVDDDSVVWFEDRLCVPNDQALREKVMTEAHSSPFTIHPGSTKMYRDLKQYFWWNGMKQDVATFVSKCMTCQQVKIEHQRASGLLQPLEIPVWKWDEISMDFVTGLQKAWGTRLKFSTAFHPQTDGQSERTIQTLEDMLRACALEWTGETLIEGPELIEITNEKVVVAKEKLKEARSRQKSYADKHRRDLEFQVGDRVFLKVSSIHRGYHYHPLHVASYPFDQIQPDMSLSEEPESILDRQERVMRNKVIPFVKILWKNHPEREATWETEESMRASYPHFFV